TCEHAVERTSAVQNMSLTASGIPSSGPAFFCAMRASEAFAISAARSGVSSTNGLSALAPSIEFWCARANSTAENDFLFSPSRASAKVSEVKSVTARAHRQLFHSPCAWTVRSVLRQQSQVGVG